MIEPLPAWYVAFHDSDRPNWLTRWLRPGFRHCFAFAWDAEGGRWLIVNMAFEGGFVRVLPNENAAAMWANLHRMKARVLLAAVENMGPRRPRLLGSCVTLIVALLGLRGACALTPWRLYRTLLARNATEVLGGP